MNEQELRFRIDPREVRRPYSESLQFDKSFDMHVVDNTLAIVRTKPHGSRGLRKVQLALICNSQIPIVREGLLRRKTPIARRQPENRLTTLFVTLHIEGPSRAIYVGGRRQYKICGLSQKPNGITTITLASDHPIKTEFYRPEREPEKPMDILLEYGRKNKDRLSHNLSQRFSAEPTLP